MQRGLAVTFTLAVLANFAVIGREPIAHYVGAFTLLPLFLLLFSGRHLFVLPSLSRRGS